MLRFFRTLRRKLLEEEKIRTYFWYAVGEVFLVVIGILIALQINNWNQNRLNHLKSLDYHHRIIVDLETIEQNLVRDSERAAEVFESLVQSVEIMESGILSDSSKQTLDFMLINFYQFVLIDNEIPTYEEMKSSGNIGLIYDLELRSEIAKFLNFYKGISQIYNQMGNSVNNTAFIDPYLREKYSSLNAQPEVEYDFNELISDPLVINTFYRYTSQWRSKTLFSNRLSEMAGELKMAVQLELEVISE